jgi:hypothetical protein
LWYVGLMIDHTITTQIVACVRKMGLDEARATQKTVANCVYELSALVQAFPDQLTRTVELVRQIELVLDARLDAEDELDPTRT